MSAESCPLKGTRPCSRRVTVQNVFGMPPLELALDLDRHLLYLFPNSLVHSGNRYR